MMYSYCAYGLNFASEIYLPECCAGSPASPVFSIVRTQVEKERLEQTNVYRKNIMAQTEAGLHHAYVLHWDGIATYRAVGGTLLEAEVYTEIPEELSLFTVSEALGLILFQRNYFLLHAGAVRVGDEAWVFMGVPGAGKSTTTAAFVKAGCALISDDLTAITLDAEGQAWVHPGYPQLKIWEPSVRGLGYDPATLPRVREGENKFSIVPKDSFSLAPVRLGRLYFLHNDPAKKPERELNRVELPAATLQHFPLPNQFLTEEVLKRLFFQSLGCGRSAAAFARRRPEGFRALERWVDQRIQETQ